MNKVITITNTKVEKEIFFQLLPINRIIHDIAARRFSIITIDNMNLGISWASDLIEPTLVYIEKFDIIIIGIDRRVVAISRLNKNIVFSMGLVDFFLFFIETEFGFVVVAEATVIGVNGNSLSVNKFVTVPEIISECTVFGDKYTIKCIDGTEYNM